MVLENEDKLSTLSRIISQELLKEKYYAACFPAALIFYEEAKRKGYQPKILLGQLTHKLLENYKIPVMHFCVKVEDKLYDPSVEMLVHYTGVDPNDFQFQEKDDVAFTEEENLMKKLFLKVISTEDTRCYFSIAPEKLLAVKRNTRRRASKIFKK